MYANVLVGIWRYQFSFEGFTFLIDKNGSKCGGRVLSTDTMDSSAKWKCDKCGENRMWNNEDLAGIENNLASRLDDNENDIKVIWNLSLASF